MKIWILLGLEGLADLYLNNIHYLLFDLVDLGFVLSHHSNLALEARRVIHRQKNYNISGLYPLDLPNQINF